MENCEQTHVRVCIVKSEEILIELTRLVCNLLDFFLLLLVLIGASYGDALVWEEGVSCISSLCQFLLVFLQLLVHRIANFGLCFIHILNSSHVNSLLQVRLKSVYVIRRCTSHELADKVLT